MFDSSHICHRITYSSSLSFYHSLKSHFAIIMLLLLSVISLLRVTESQQYTQSDCDREFVTRHSQERIHNGIPVNDSRFPWIVSLQTPEYDYVEGDLRHFESRKHYCGASLIEPDILITAAHCAPSVLMKQKPVDHDWTYLPVRIVAGCNMWDANYKCQVRSAMAADFFIHPAYKGSLHDVAIVKLNKPFIMNDKVRTICLPPAGAKYQGLATIAGWGENKLGSKQMSDILRSAVVTILSHKWCSSQNETFPNELIYCVGFERSHGHRSACFGDSGSPLMTKVNDRSIVIGVTSRGIGCSGRGGVIYERLAERRVWIDQTITQQRSKL